MIDIENILRSKASSAIKTFFPKITISSEFTNAPAAFPHVAFYEYDNFVVKKHRTSNVENYSNLVYEVVIASNKANGKKEECKKILTIIDKEMANYNFTRISKQAPQNLVDNTVYRIVAKYEAISDDGTTIEEITNYRLYQN